MELLYFILGLCPILWLIFALTVLKMPTYKAALGSLIVAGVLAFIVWQLPAMEVLTAALEGILMAIWPIVVVIIAAVFTYNLSLRTGGIDVIKQMITSVSNDKRIIPAGMLLTLGFDPIFSCLVCLIANGAPTPFGSIGIPTVTLANLVGLENTQLSFITSLQLAPFMLVIPFLIVMVTGKGPKALKGVTGITLATGISFVIPQLAVSYFVGAELAVVVGSVCSLLVTVLLASKKKTDPAYEMKVEKHSINAKDALKSCSPFIFIFIFLLSTSKLIAPVNDFLAQFASTIYVYSGENPNAMTFTWINTAGVWIFLSAILGGLIQKASFNDFKEVFIATLKQMKETIITMLCVLGCAKIMGYAGMIASIATFAIAVTGSFYPFVAPCLGCLGTFVTGSGTSSGVLFGAVQQNAAVSLNADPYWIVALNSLGVAAGKMLSPQSIAIALSSVDQKGKDSILLSKILPYGLGFLIAMALIAYIGLQLFY